MSEIRAGSDLERDGKGHFLPGVSGNRVGRPKGIADRRLRAKDDLLGPLLPKAVEKLAAEVEKGERWAIELVVNLSIPKPRPVDAEEIQELEARLQDLEQLAARRLK